MDKAVLDEFNKLKRVPPKAGEPRVKKFGPREHELFKKVKTYHWCEHYQMWTIHKSEDCTLGHKRDAEVEERKKDSIGYASLLELFKDADQQE